MSATKTISNSFVVTTVEDGVSQPYYIETQETWSNVASVANSSTEPSPNAGWFNYTPAKGSWTYLWRRSRTMTLNEETREYVAGPWSYQRLSGENGTSISVKGTVATINDLPTTHADGDAYVVEADRHLYMWSSEAGRWLDIGEFKGESGKTYYTHIAWATDVTIGGNVPSKPTGQTTTPNASSVTGFTVSPVDGCKWIGVMVNETVADSTTANLYTWQESKGEDAVVYFITANQSNMTILSDETSVSNSITARLWRREGETSSLYSAYLGIYTQNVNGTRTRVASATDSSITASVTADTSTKCVEVYAWETAPSTSEIANPSTYLARVEISVTKHGDTGPMGESNIQLTLDNVQDTVVIDTLGTMLIPANVTIAKLWDGHTQITDTTKMSFDAYLNGRDIINDTSGAFRIVNNGPQTSGGVYIGNEFEFENLEALTPDSYRIEIGCTYNGVRYTAIWGINIIQGDDKYEVEITPDNVAFNTSAGTPSSVTASVRIYHIDATQERTQITSLPGSQWRLRYYTSSATPSYDQGGNLTLNSGVWTFNLTASNLRTYNYYQVALWYVDRNGNYAIADIDTIEFIKAANGADGVTYEILPNIESITIPSDQSSTTVDLSAQFVTRASDGTTSSVNLNTVVAYRNTDGTYPSSVILRVNNVPGFSSPGTQITNAAQAVVIFTYPLNITPTASNYTTVWTNKREIPVISNGSTGGPGPKGDIGRGYYYDGEYDSSKTYELTATQAPYVSYNGLYWLRVGEDGSTTTDVPSSSSADWSIMTNDFKYLITEAMFTDFAKLGSAIFNRDWMYSQYSNSLTFIYSGSYTASAQSWTQIGSTFEVKQGVKYSVFITCRCTTSSGAVFQVFYGSSSGAGRLHATGTTSAIYTLNFVGEQDGEANIRVYANANVTCYVTRIALDINGNYTDISPSFMNNDTLVLYDNSVNMTSVYNTSTSTTYTPIVNAPVYLVAGKSYKVVATARKNASTSSTLYVRMRWVGTSTNVSSTYMYFSTVSFTTKNFTVTPTESGWAYPVWGFASSSSNNNVHLTYLAIEPDEPHVPMVAVDWLTGYAHFGGDRIRFNPDGSGHVAGGNLRWDVNGNMRVKHTFALCKIVGSTATSSPQTLPLLASQKGSDYTTCFMENVAASSGIDGDVSDYLPSRISLYYPSNYYGASYSRATCSVILPPATDYIGLEIEIMAKGNDSGCCEFCIQGGSSSSLVLLDPNLNNLPYGITINVDERSGRSSYTYDGSGSSFVRLLAVSFETDGTNYYGWMVMDSHNAYIGS